MTSPDHSLRIVFVAPFGLRHKSTVWARTLPMARELKRQGHHASILVPPWDSPQDSGVHIVRDGVDIVHVDIRGGVPAASARMVRSINSESPHIVHIVKPRAHAGIVQWLLWQARRASARPVRILLDIDDWEAPWAAINRYPRYQASFLSWQEEWGIRHADGISAASRWLYDRAASMAPSTPRLYLPNGIDGGSAKHRHSYALHRPPRVLLFSRFMEVGPAWLGEMWWALRRKAPDAVLYVAGRALHAGGEEPFLRALAAGASGLTPANVIWRGYVNPNDLSSLYDSVDCAIFPSDDAALHRAKCSVRLATALHHGVPAVASAVGEQAAYGGDGAACLVPANSGPAEFADAVAAVLLNSDMRRALGTAAVERMNRHYTWRTLGEPLGRFYAQMLQDE